MNWSEIVSKILESDGEKVQLAPLSNIDGVDIKFDKAYGTVKINVPANIANDLTNGSDKYVGGLLLIDREAYEKNKRRCGMSCKNCLHRDVCYYIEHYGRDLDSNEPCDHFRDSTKMIEVPCVIGDTLYSIWEDDEGVLQISEDEVIDVSEKMIWVNGGGFSVDSIGKSDFFSREEAKKAIKERESLGH